MLMVPAMSEATPIQWNSGTGNTGHWYEVVLVPGGIDWNTAQTAAAASGGYLATLLSTEENAFAFALADNASYWQFEAPGSNALIGPWLGGFQPAGSAEPAGGWTWLNGDGSFVYTNWTASEPNNGAGAPHGLTESSLHFFNYSTRAGTWNDFPATLTTPVAYVVEFNSQPGTTAPVPEPGTLVLSALGLAAIAVVRTRKATATNAA